METHLWRMEMSSKNACTNKCSKRPSESYGRVLTQFRTTSTAKKSTWLSHLKPQPAKIHIKLPN